LDVVHFIPTAISPFKQNSKPTEANHRIEMIRLAIGGNPSFVLDTRELSRGGVSYTIDTVQSLANDFPESELILLMGADSLSEIAQWKSPQSLLQLVRVAAIARGGFGTPNWDALRSLVTAERFPDVQLQVTAPQLEISSTVIRKKVRQGTSIRYQVPAAVEEYIKQHKLYRA
jgi:nicotinate-nucleotide adenylyltransferase